MVQLKFIFYFEKMNKKMTIQFQANIYFMKTWFLRKISWN